MLFKIDDFLYKDVGYALLNNLVMGLFPSAYAATSLREYFARGFEELKLLDLGFSTLGCMGWLVVSLIWKDRALIILNSLAVFVLGSGIVRYFLT